MNESGHKSKKKVPAGCGYVDVLWQSRRVFVHYRSGKLIRSLTGLNLEVLATSCFALWEARCEAVLAWEPKIPAGSATRDVKKKKKSWSVALALFNCAVSCRKCLWQLWKQMHVWIWHQTATFTNWTCISSFYYWPWTKNVKIGCFLVFTICVTFSNPRSPSSSETGVNPGIRSWRSTYLNQLDVTKPLVESISQRSEELRLYNLV